MQITETKNPSAESSGRGLEQARAAVRNNAVGIIVALIDHAKENGSYMHAKFLFEFAGISGPESLESAGPDEDNSLARLLLRELDENNPN